MVHIIPVAQAKITSVLKIRAVSQAKNTGGVENNSSGTLPQQ